VKLELPKQNNYETSYSRAAELLRESDWNTVAAETGVDFRDNRFTVPYFSGTYSIAVPEVEFQDDGLPLIERILILHYLTTRTDYPAESKPVQFKNLPGGSFYEATYRKRGPNLIVRKFAGNPQSLLKAGESLHGKAAEYGDASVTIPILPKIDATVILYEGDEEFPPEASILYTGTIIRYLSLEDVALLAGMIYKHLKSNL
jgi:hypothetical protein